MFSPIPNEWYVDVLHCLKACEVDKYDEDVPSEHKQ